MGGEEELFELFDDLEAQAESLHHLERSAEVADRARAEYQAVTLDSRLVASLDTDVELEVRGVGRVRGTLERVGPGWCQLARDGARWTLRTPEVSAVLGASARSVPEVARTAVQRLTIASALRRLADQGTICVVYTSDGSRHEGAVRRVGSDFFELRAGVGVRLLGLGQVSAIRSED
jgi:hypothetical protein